ncbi:hypothetical protein AB6V29_02565 [Microbacterium sp. 20-116]|uniref:hypothetical protein n=1 Tax=Microbacterium sp. 20-116 TaxID=3239883 RepID=UPI0034E2875E
MTTTDQPSWAPCVSCGIRVEGPFGADDLEAVSAWGNENSGGYREESEFAVARCGVCAQIRTAAGDLLRAHPSVRASIGSPEIALHRLELALNALDALGVTDPRVIDRLTDRAADVHALLSHMTVPGGVARWVHQLVGVHPNQASKTQVRGQRWAHVTSEQKAALRRAWVELAAERYEQPRPVLCPSDDGLPSGCLLCGVAAVKVLPSEARRNGVWAESSADPVTIGGLGAAESVDGYVCPRCDLAIDQARGVGQSSMRLSVLDYLGVPGHNRTVTEVDGLVGWGVLPRGTTPNSEPWQHVDLSHLREATKHLVAVAG